MSCLRLAAFPTELEGKKQAAVIDDTGLCPALVYAESLSSWRLLDGRWLVHHRLEPFGEDDEVAEGLGIERARPR
jgi:hypothetical protein